VGFFDFREYPNHLWRSLAIIASIQFMLTATIGRYKKAYTGLSKETWLLSIVILINRSGTMVMSFMSFYCIDKLHFSVSQVGIILSMFGAGSIIGALLSGRIVDKVGFYYVQFFTLLFGGGMFFIVAELKGFMSICIGVFFLSLINESFRPANSTAIAHYSSEENRTRSYSLNRLAINLGFSVGVAIGGFLAAKSYYLLFWVDGATNIAAAFFLLKLLPPVKSKQHHKQAEVLGQSPFKDARFLVFLLMLVLFATCFMQLFGMHQVFLKTIWHITETGYGMVMALNGMMIVLIEMIMIHALEGRKNPLYFIRMGVLLVGIGLVCMNILNGSLLAAAISMVFITFGEMFALPFMNTYWISRTQSNNRGRYAALYTATWSIAHVTAPVIGSQVVAHSGFNMLWWIVGIICLLVIAIAFALQGNNNKVVHSNR
jgi:predicted MFS family arabinose efflux permease